MIQLEPLNCDLHCISHKPIDGTSIVATVPKRDLNLFDHRRSYAEQDCRRIETVLLRVKITRGVRG